MKRAMSKSRIKWLFLLSNVVSPTPTLASKASNLTTLRLPPRGGSSPYEINPNYAPPRQPVTLGDLEQRSYEPPYQQQRYHVEIPKQTSVLDQVKQYIFQLHDLSPTLSIGSASCIFIWILWQRPQCLHFLQRNFVCSRYNLRKGRHYTTLTSAVSHASFTHLLVNLFAYLSFGPTLVQTLSSLWPLVVGAALFSSQLYLVFSKNGGGCMGLSGVTLAFLAVFARMYPQRELGVMFMGIIPVRMQAQVALLALLVWSVVGSMLRIGNVAHAAHLGGLLFGMGYYELWKKRAMLRRIRGTVLGRRK